MMLRLLQSVGITVAISLLIGSVFYLFNNNFWLPFCVATIVQFALWFIVSYISDIYIKIKTEQIATERMKDLARIGTTVDCAFCSEEAFVPVDLSIDNTYTCLKCSKENLILITTRTAQTTQPVTKTGSEVLNKVEEGEDQNNG